MGLLESAIESIKQLGFPISVALGACGAWYYERKENKEMVRQLLELTKALTEVAYKNEAALEALRNQLREP